MDIIDKELSNKKTDFNLKCHISFTSDDFLYLNSS